jgi:hypothetical protein
VRLPWVEAVAVALRRVAAAEVRSVAELVVAAENTLLAAAARPAPKRFSFWLGC